MEGAAKKAAQPKQSKVVAAVPSSASSQSLLREVERIMKTASITVAASLSGLREAIERHKPQVILLDERVMEAESLAGFIAEVSPRAAIVLVARYDRESQIARFVASGDVEFVTRSGEWTKLAASLVERRLRWAEQRKPPMNSPDGHNIGELFRHEINNPLTGILGNAELILAHSDRLPAIDTQRIRTVVELAVRLRETVRRVSNAWDERAESAKSA